jgi:feruloyl esterase
VREIINAADPDLSAFHKRGGKLILTHGWADQALNPLRTIEYYESVRTKMGAATDEFLRFYLMPGVLHCGGGPGAGNFDQLSLLVKWVEESKAPERIVASRMENGKATRTRPLCPYPQVAKYKGMGNVDDEASFVCAGEVSRR